MEQQIPISRKGHNMLPEMTKLRTIVITALMAAVLMACGAATTKRQCRRHGAGERTTDRGIRRHGAGRGRPDGHDDRNRDRQT